MEINNMQKKVLILGIGNVLWADEGFGVRAVEQLDQDYLFEQNVTLMDGGTQGIYLVQHIQACDILVVFDAVDYALPGGTLKCVEDDEVPKFLGVKKVSLHQTGFQEVLAMAQMLGEYPEKILLIGVQPVELEDYGGSLRPQVKAQIQPAIDRALSYLEQFNVGAQKRKQRIGGDQKDGAVIANMLRYEQQRPDELNAYRYGDHRVIHSADYSLLYRPEVLEGNALNIGVDQHLEAYRNVSQDHSPNNGSQ